MGNRVADTRPLRSAAAWPRVGGRGEERDGRDAPTGGRTRDCGAGAAGHGRLRAAARLVRGAGEATRAAIEPLEGRRLMSAEVAGAPGEGGATDQPHAAHLAALATAGPAVTSTTPGNNAVNVLRDAFVSANL